MGLDHAPRAGRYCHEVSTTATELFSRLLAVLATGEGLLILVPWQMMTLSISLLLLLLVELKTSGSRQKPEV